VLVKRNPKYPEEILFCPSMKKRIYILWHVLAWTLLIARQVYVNYAYYKDSATMAASVHSSGISPLTFFMIYCTTFMMVNMAFFYSAYGWIGPNLYPRPRWVRAVLGLLGSLTLTVLTRYLVEYHIHKPLLHFDNYFGRPLDLKFYIPNCLLFSQEYFLYGLCLYILVQSYRIRDEKKEAELALLKSQTNPHFLFNTINDIYSLTYQKSDEAPEALLKLSGILRYTLYDGATEFVPLQKELDYLKDYLDLQRMGAKNKSYIEFRIEGDASGHRIVPLLLIPFAENIIKHGITDEPGKPAQLFLTIEKNRFMLIAKNEIRTQHKDKTGGIGLPNVSRRLELLYPHRHRFEVLKENGKFHCQMEIQL
jgi:two-component system LytT family sensor kinase